jgi:2-hydroxycyclohexanecarboxyl-CoA dehydrogenase
MTRVVVVTGGASGMGLSICEQLARQGNAVVVVDVNGENAERVASGIRAVGDQAVACQADVSDRAEVDAAMQLGRETFGAIGMLVVSAGVTKREPFSEITLESWNRIMAINLTGTFHCVQSAIPDMVEAGWGRIVLITSSSAQRGAPGMAHYASSKGGMIALNKTLALEYAKAGVTVNNIAPSSIDTPMVLQQQAAGGMPSNEQLAKRVPVGRLGTGDDIAAACSYLCSEEASFITGQTISVNGGSFVGW